MEATTSKRRLDFVQDEDHNGLFTDDESVPIHKKLPEATVPTIGMEFDTEDEAYKFYNAYAREIGFSVRKSKVHKNDGKALNRNYVCSCEGKRGPDKRDDVYKCQQPETRCGCLAMMKISCRQFYKYRVVKFTAEHNHNLSSPSKTHMFRSHRKMSNFQELEVDMAEKSGIAPKRTFEYMAKQAGGRDKLGFAHEDLKNYLRTKRSLQMRSGETGGVLEYLQGMQVEYPNFFYAIQVDEDDLMTNIFWADAKMMADYDAFGDVVCFDTTYRKHKDGRPIALFVGVNHHKQTSIFGVALLYDETSDSFVWLFDTFGKAMGGKLPKTMLTDQDAAMSKALSFQWPETYHRLCIWHIYQNATIHLNNVLGEYKEFSTDFSKCVYEYDYEEDFLDAWNKMLDKYNLQDNAWLKRLFNIKEKWALVYGRDTFCADMMSTQRSESMNKVIKDYISYKNSLRTFFQNFQQLLSERRYDETMADFKASQSRVVLPVPVKILTHAALVYTPKVFTLFQEELCKAYDCHIESQGESGSAGVYVVTPYGKHYTYIVSYDFAIGETVSCSCRKFEFAGILCSHILKMFSIRGVLQVPEKYILKRWTKDAKKGTNVVINEASLDISHRGVVGRRYRDLCRLSTRLSTRAADSEDFYSMVKESLTNMLKDLDLNSAAKPLESDIGSPQVKGNHPEISQNTTSMNNNLKKVKGIKLKPKSGNGSSLRIRGGLEKAKKTRKSKKIQIKAAGVPNHGVKNFNVHFQPINLTQCSSSTEPMKQQEKQIEFMELQTGHNSANKNAFLQVDSLSTEQSPLLSQSPLMPLLQQCDDYDAYARLLQNNK